ncbi:cell envelope integrity protein TolA [Aliikangiella coralliicola]|uniref:Cell envelope integrity protein TolA n=1 Tax=Aliikangiella coralliicola TaxID=2592383 RepID=A0A545UBS9_9GAMM|nr:cell envelope integrity protein TolA [Aliikangiella coralliicola]TQV86918.1 cell envelope integrity protein TolA [Aliikangiella coralliicola]
MKLNNAILLSIVAHIGLVALLVSNYQFAKIEVKQSSAPMEKINAKAINSQRVEQLVKKLKQEKLDQKRKEKQRLDQLKKAEDDAKRKRVEEEKKADDARKKRKKAEEKRKAEEKKAADLKKKRIKEEKERKKKADAEKKRKAEAERKRKLEEERKRKAKAEAERKRKEAEEKARQEAIEREMQAQMDAEAAELEAAHRQQVLSEVDKFNQLIRGKIKRNWFKPEKKGSCTFRIGIAPDGLVYQIEVVRGDPVHCESGRRAILRAEPLPMSKDPDVYAELKTRTFELENENDEDSL